MVSLSLTPTPAPTAAWQLTERERATLAAALDALLPPQGAFPAPSATGLIDDFILRQVPPAGEQPAPYPRLSADDLRTLLHDLANASATGESADAPHAMTTALQELEAHVLARFTALWRLAVFGYYSRPEVIAAIQFDHAPAYHGAPLPLGYAHAIEPWDASDPLQFPVAPRGHYVATDDVRRVDLSGLPAHVTSPHARSAPPQIASDAAAAPPVDRTPASIDTDGSKH
jgi:hypothetical protein